SSPSPAPLLQSPLAYAPFLPTDLLRQHGAFIATDTRFAAATRLLAALWRADRGLTAGLHVRRLPNGRTRSSPAGWRLRPDAAKADAAFFSAETAAFVQKALVLREPGALWDEAKIRGNLLSSAGLALNLFVAQALDLTLATRVWARLLPDFVHQVTAIRFETSPGRDDPTYLGDGTAFDLVVDVITPDGEPAFIAIKLKFIEAMVGPAASPRPRYTETAHESRLFVDPANPLLYRPGLEQLRREHCLAQLMVDQSVTSRACFVLVGPRLNRRVTASAKLYAAQLVNPAGASPDRVGFVHLTLETVLAALHAAGAEEQAEAIFVRYLDLDRVAALALGDPPPEPPTTAAPLLLLPAPSSTDVPTAAARARACPDRQTQTGPRPKRLALTRRREPDIAQSKAGAKTGRPTPSSTYTRRQRRSPDVSSSEAL
ncbi:hypothetical protein, partial [Methylobacterium sp. WL12]|uniref:PGN_0703 family putative restriction endonuclease n=1 Tax=Methylobacterium sp. WL12 TaxID=2603890 RepID=UPI00165035FE